MYWAAACAPETLDASFGSTQEAIDAGLVEKGWVPAWIPRDATDLREVHNLDTNVSELSFAKPSTTELSLPADCKPVSFSDTVPARIRREWWPAQESLERSYVFFRCQADHIVNRFVAISKSGQRVLHWRTYER